MPGGYLVSTLALEQVLAAFPLVSVLDPGVTEEQWSDYATALVKSPDAGENEGIITVQSDQGYIHGLSVYKVKQDLRRGRLLEIENFAVVNLTGTGNAAKVLLGALEDLARERGCYCISLGMLNPKMRRWLRQPRHPVADLFSAAGFRGEPLRLRKCFDTEG